MTMTEFCSDTSSELVNVEIPSILGKMAENSYFPYFFSQNDQIPYFYGTIGGVPYFSVFLFQNRQIPY